MDVDKPEIIQIYEHLPEVRKKVLNMILVGCSNTKIAKELFEGDKFKIKDYRKEIYKDFREFLKDVDPESKLSTLIILFYTEAPNLVARLQIEIGDHHISSRSCQASQFGELVDELSRQRNEYQFELHQVYNKREIPRLQALGRRYFKSQDHLPTKLLESWYEKDPNYFRQIINKNGILVGFFIVLFLKSEAFNNFARGKILKKNLILLKLFQPENYKVKEKIAFT